MRSILRNSYFKQRRFWLPIIGVIGLLAMLILAITIPLRTTATHADIGDSDWTTFLGDNGRSNFSASETAINPLTAPNLHLSWQHSGKGSITAQPIIANGILYWGSWDGYERAKRLSTGKGIWSRYLGNTKDTNCHPPAAGVASTPTIATVSINGQPTSVLFVGGGNSIFYALDANTGKVIWKRVLGTSPSYFLWSSPAVYNGYVYEGVSSFGDCPLIPGQLVQMNASTGKIVNTFNTVPAGCIGASVWGSPTIDEAAGTIYFATGNGGKCSVHEKLAYSLIELNASDLSFVASWKVPQLKGDNDFGSTPTLFSATINGSLYNMIGLLNKNGFYYAFDRNNIAAGPLWQDQLAVTQDLGGGDDMSSSAWDGTRLYVAANQTTLNGTNCSGSLSAINPADGSFLWRDCLNHYVESSVTAAPGLVVIGVGANMNVYSTADGSTLFSYHDTNKNASFLCTATISNGVLYDGDVDGSLFAFVL